MSLEISIIIPTLNEETLLPGLLGDLSKQVLPSHEIIVADANSSDRTREIARSYGARVVSGGLPPVGRNKGAQFAQGKFLFFLDADVRVPPNFLVNAYTEIEERFLDLATCEVVPLSERSVDKFLHDFANLAIKLGQFSEPHAYGCCIFVSKRLFKRVGGFDESLKMAEDHDFVKRASQFRPLRVIHSTQVFISVRRLDQEGRVKLINKYLAVELHRVFLGEIKNEIFEYEFGDFTKANEAEAEAKIGEIRKLIAKIQQSYGDLLSGIGGVSILSNGTSERFAALREQFDKLKELLGSMLKFHRNNPENHDDEKGSSGDLSSEPSGIDNAHLDKT